MSSAHHCLRRLTRQIAKAILGESKLPSDVVWTHCRANLSSHIDCESVFEALFHGTFCRGLLFCQGQCEEEGSVVRIICHVYLVYLFSFVYLVYLFRVSFALIACLSVKFEVGSVAGRKRNEQNSAAVVITTLVTYVRGFLRTYVRTYVQDLLHYASRVHHCGCCCRQ